MKMLKKVIGLSLLMPLMGFAASEKINDWGFEPNGELRAVVGNETVLVSPKNQDEYYQTLMAARLGWKVEAVNGAIVVDRKSVPLDQTALLGLSRCGEVSTCSYNNLTPVTYGCMLDSLEQTIVAAKGTYDPNTWPQPVDGEGSVKFTLPASAMAYAGNYEIKVNYSSATGIVNAAIVLKPKAAKYDPMWFMVDTAYNDAMKGC